MTFLSLMTVQGPGAASAATADWAVFAIVLIGIILSILLLGLLFAVIKIGRLAQSMRDALTRLEPSVHPVLERARAVSENLEHITRSVKHDVDQVTSSVEALNGRVRQASDRLEERIEAFNAVIEVAQSEAEGILLDTAATVRGVRAGADALTAARLRSAEGFPPEAPTPNASGSEGFEETPTLSTEEG